MDLKHEQEKEEKRKIQEYKKHPMITFADSINRSIVGGLADLTKGNFITKIITAIIIAGILFFLCR
jgi:hypothetical protein